MSASTEKKLRQAAREAGTDKKAIALQEEAAKKAKTKLKIIIWSAIVVVFIATVIFLSSDYFVKNTTAVIVGDKSYTPAEMNYYYGSEYQTFVNNYGSYTSYFGLDTSYGLQGLGSQECPMAEEEGQTWKDYFLNSAVSSVKQITALTNYAEQNGIKLDEEELQSIEDAYASLDETAVSYGYANADKFLSGNYGRGVNLKMAKEFDTARSLASKAFSAYCDTVEVSDEEVAEQYPSINVRHILVKAAADEETGEYTDEAKEAAKAKAEEIYAEWQKGEATEESFAALAEKYSEDEGSNTNGGLYENVLEGQMVTEFNDFCFAEDRAIGDTGIVYGESSAYAGYHVMYFVGVGNPAENETGRSYIINERASEWLQGVADEISVEYGSGYKYVGKN